MEGLLLRKMARNFNMEMCPSGQRYFTANEKVGKLAQRFESSHLRNGCVALIWKSPRLQIERLVVRIHPHLLDALVGKLGKAARLKIE